MSLVRSFYIVKFEQKVKNLVKVIPKCFIRLPEEERMEFLQFKGVFGFFFFCFFPTFERLSSIITKFYEMVCL